MNSSGSLRESGLLGEDNEESHSLARQGEEDGF